MHEILELILKTRNEIDDIIKKENGIIGSKHNKIEALRTKKLTLFREWRIAVLEKEVLKMTKEVSRWFQVDVELEASVKCLVEKDKPAEAKMRLRKVQGMIGVVATVDECKKMSYGVQRIIDLCGEDENDYDRCRAAKMKNAAESEPPDETALETERRPYV